MRIEILTGFFLPVLVPVAAVGQAPSWCVAKRAWQRATVVEAVAEVRRVTPLRFLFRRDLNQAISDSSCSIADRIVPVFRDGTSIGFKLFGVTKRSYSRALGFQNGDVVRAINGHQLTSAEKALEVYSLLKSVEHLVVEIERSEACVVIEVCLLGEPSTSGESSAR